MSFAALFSYVFLTAFTPGPNNIMSMTNASKYGLKKAFPFNLGVLFGVLIIMSISAVFSSILFGVIPALTPAMRFIGAAYILWLAWSVWRDVPHEGRKGLLQTNTIASGMLLQLVNVKVILYSLTVMSAFILPHYSDVVIISAFIFLLSFIGFSATICWAVFGAVFEGLFKKYGKILNAVMALLLVYCAATMIFDI